MNQLLKTFSRLFERPRPESFHFHSAGEGRAFVCHDARCASPRLDARDAR